MMIYSSKTQVSTLAAWSASLLCAVALSLTAVVSSIAPASAESANPYSFEKKAYKPDGTPWTGPVNVGDIIKYVLSYQPGSSNSGPVTIDDTLSPNLSYVAPTKASDSSWTWGTAPYATGNHEPYNHPGFGPGAGSVKVTVTGNAPPVNGQGDGTIPVPVLSLNKVFGVYHHVPIGATSSVDCWDLGTLAKCPGYPKSSTTGSYIMITPITPQSVVRGSKVFFAGLRGATATATSGIPTIACFDGATDAACADTPFATGLTGTMASVGGLVEDPVSQKVFGVVSEKVFCWQLAGSTWTTCGGWSPTGNVSVTPTPATLYNANTTYIQVEQSSTPSRVYIHHGSGIIQCLQISNGTPCAGWAASGFHVGSASNGTSLSSIPDNAGTGCMPLGAPTPSFRMRQQQRWALAAGQRLWQRRQHFEFPHSEHAEGVFPAVGNPSHLHRLHRSNRCPMSRLRSSPAFWCTGLWLCA